MDKRIHLPEALLNKRMDENKIDLSTMLYMRHKGLEYDFTVPFCSSIYVYDEAQTRDVHTLGGLVNVFAVDNLKWLGEYLDRLELNTEDTYCIVFNVADVEPLLDKMYIWQSTLIGINCGGVVDNALQDAIKFIGKRFPNNPIIVYGVASDFQVSQVWSWGADYVFRGIPDQSQYSLASIEQYKDTGYIPEVSSEREALYSLANGASMVMLGAGGSAYALRDSLVTLMRITGVYKFRDLYKELEIA